MSVIHDIRIPGEKQEREIVSMIDLHPSFRKRTRARRLAGSLEALGKTSACSRTTVDCDTSNE